MSRDSVKLYYALSVLFPKEQLESPAFLASLDTETLKKAFRTKVMQCHPDLIHNLPESFRRNRHERFIRIQQAHEFLNGYLETARERGEDIPWPQFKRKVTSDVAEQCAPQRKLIFAVGGAKGGIGKTIVSANLSAGLASLGKRVIAVDLDLGGANLHLHLGVKFPPLTLQHYFKGGKPLNELCLDTAVKNLRIIAGDSSNLGMANILTAQKKKLIKDLQCLPADYVVIDLGGDTSYNMVDFFLAADERIAVTSPEPSSVLDVYNFIKVSLLRYLNKNIFDILRPEEARKLQGRINEFKGLIFETTTSSDHRRIKRIDELLALVREKNTDWGLFLQEKMDEFCPYLVVNMIEAGADGNISTRIAEIARQNLSINILPLPGISFDREVKNVVHYLVPVLLERPKSQASRCVFNILRTILQRHIGDRGLCQLLENATEEKIAPAFFQFIKGETGATFGNKQKKVDHVYAGWR
ncbi:MAG: P-loop NTPase [Thermodesulfobacteriota bacterium]